MIKTANQRLGCTLGLVVGAHSDLPKPGMTERVMWRIRHHEAMSKIHGQSYRLTAMKAIHGHRKEPPRGCDILSG